MNTQNNKLFEAVEQISFKDPSQLIELANFKLHLLKAGEMVLTPEGAKVLVEQIQLINYILDESVRHSFGIESVYGICRKPISALPGFTSLLNEAEVLTNDPSEYTKRLLVNTGEDSIIKKKALPSVEIIEDISTIKDPAVIAEKDAESLVMMGAKEEVVELCNPDNPDRLANWKEEAYNVLQRAAICAYGSELDHSAIMHIISHAQNVHKYRVIPAEFIYKGKLKRTVRIIQGFFNVIYGQTLSLKDTKELINNRLPETSDSIGWLPSELVKNKSLFNVLLTQARKLLPVGGRNEVVSIISNMAEEIGIEMNIVKAHRIINTVKTVNKITERNKAQYQKHKVSQTIENQFKK